MVSLDVKNNANIYEWELYLSPIVEFVFSHCTLIDDYTIIELSSISDVDDDEHDFCCSVKMFPLPTVFDYTNEKSEFLSMDKTEHLDNIILGLARALVDMEKAGHTINKIAVSDDNKFYFNSIVTRI